MNLYRKALTAVLLLACNYTYAQVEQDGPYVTRSANKILVSYVLSNEVITDTLAGNEAIQVRFAQHSDWDFSFKLHANIAVQPVAYKPVDKLMVLSDIEGEFEAFRSLMLANKVIDKKYNWIYGKGHMIICGDLFDRGKEVMPYLWLLYKLEEDARRKGGFVHVLLGNHDVMNLAGDLRYVAPKYQASEKLLGLSHAQLISPETEIGKWLRSKNAIEKIGDKLFLHGGISPEINALSLNLQAINEKCRSYYGIPTKKLDEEGKLFMSASGPFWYRGYFGKNRTNIATVDSTLIKFDVKQIIVGHTITAQNIAAYYGGKVVGVDVDQHRGNRKALLFKGKQTFVVDDKQQQKILTLAGDSGEIE